MKIKHVPWLRCLDCGSQLSIIAGPISEEQIENGVIGCNKCRRLYPVLGGAAVLFCRNSGHSLNPAEIATLAALGYAPADFAYEAKELSSDERKQVAVLKNWEYQWDEIHPFTQSDLDSNGFLGQDAFKNFIPIASEKVAGTTVLVGGAGRGREVYHLSRMGAATIIALDLGREIYAARKLLQSCSSTEILLIRSDLVNIPLQTGLVDIAICDHALQHVHNHRQGFNELARVTRSEGLTAICVYSWEGNFLMTHMVEPAKSVLHRIPLKMLFMLSFFPAFVLHFIIMCLYVPAAMIAPAIARRIPLFDHMILWSKNRFITTWMSIFDLFHAPISYHFRREEVTRLAEENNMTIECLRHTNRVLWSMIARKNATNN